MTAIILSSGIDTPGLAENVAAGVSGECFLDITVDGQQAGRVLVALPNPSSIGAQRFRDLCKGRQGVGYRRSKFDALFPVSDRS
jgi:peptidyl-prolyl cis-trans isomerase B (cyclophilin B)